MIRRFGCLYAGHVDMDDIGYSGRSVNDRRYSNEHLSTVLDTSVALSKHMDKLGYDDLWMAEHHFQTEGYECIPNLLQLSVHLADKTDRIRFGCGFNISPMWHPLRLAEDFAMADILTRGRVRFGVGRGYHTREVEAVGAPLLDRDANRDLFEEQVEIILKSFNEESFSYHGQHYDIPPKVPYRGYELEEITLVPRPVNQPVECWQPVVSGSERGFEFMAKHKIKGYISGGANPFGNNNDAISLWRQVQSRHGVETELGGNLILGISIHIAETQEKAKREAGKLFEEYLKMFAPLGFAPGMSDEQISILSDSRKAAAASLPNIDEAIERGSWICGPPDHVIEQLEEVQKEYPGLEQINLGNYMGAPRAMMLDQLEWFGKEVMPAFKGQDNINTAADN